MKLRARPGNTNFSRTVHLVRPFVGSLRHATQIAKGACEVPDYVLEKILDAAGQKADEYFELI